MCLRSVKSNRFSYKIAENQTILGDYSPQGRLLTYFLTNIKHIYDILHFLIKYVKIRTIVFFYKNILSNLYILNKNQPAELLK